MKLALIPSVEVAFAPLTRTASSTNREFLALDAFNSLLMKHPRVVSSAG